MEDNTLEKILEDNNIYCGKYTYYFGCCSYYIFGVIEEKNEDNCDEEITYIRNINMSNDDLLESKRL